MASKGICNETTGILDLIDRLQDMAKPVINDKRQKKYCKYVSMFLSHFGQERCIVVGSTQEKTRLRLEENEGDFDYLIISRISIPTECLEYREKLPCFVNINGSILKDMFPGVELIDEKYLPSDLLSNIRSEAFKHIRNIHTIVTQIDSTRGRSTLHVALNHKIKPGVSKVDYADPKCPELCIAQSKQKKDPEQIKHNVEKNLQGESREVKQMTCSTVEAISSIVNEYEKISQSSDSAKTIFHQTYDSVIEAFKNSTDILNETSPSQPKKPKLGSSDDLSKSYNSDVPSTSGLPRRMNNESHSEGEGRRNEAEDKVLIQYSYKTSKDFIPVFPLKGKPKYLDEWQNRKRNWPPTDVVTDIYNSEFFVVAKPALIEPSQDIDFCLACNIGEIKLAKAMTQLQRNVILIIKALQKSSLQEYSEILTTFHWKTVVYWVSEKTESHILENRTEETILIFLQNILAYMVDCLCENALQHYFVPSNLFADKHEDEIYDIVSKIAEIQENPIGNLKIFFRRQSTDEVNFDIISRSQITEFQEMHTDPGETSIVESVVSLLKGFAFENRENVRKALTEVLTEALPFFLEEVARGRDPNDMDGSSTIIQALLRADVEGSVLIDSIVSYLLDQMHSTDTPNVKDITRNIFALVIQNMITGN